MTREQYILEKLNEELTPIDVEEETVELLDSQYDFRRLGGPFQYMHAGEVLKHYDYYAFREILNNHIDSMVESGTWIEYQQGFWTGEARPIIKTYEEAIKHCDPFYVDHGEHRGWYFHDEMAFMQGPFCDPYDCYEYAVNQLLSI